MAQTDRQTDKSTRWQFTAYENQWELFKVMPDKIAEWGWQQEECPETGRKHYQGFIRTKTQVRHKFIRELFPGVHTEVARNWDALVNYCKKSETSIEGTQVHQVGTKAMTMKDALVRLASFASEQVEVEEGDKASDAYVRDYWKCVRSVLQDDPDAIGLYVNVAYLSAWKHTRQIWVDLYNQQSLSITALPPTAIPPENNPDI